MYFQVFTKATVEVNRSILPALRDEHQKLRWKLLERFPGLEVWEQDGTLSLAGSWREIQKAGNWLQGPQPHDQSEKAEDVGDVQSEPRLAQEADEFKNKLKAAINSLEEDTEESVPFPQNGNVEERVEEDMDMAELSAELETAPVHQAPKAETNRKTQEEKEKNTRVTSPKGEKSSPLRWGFGDRPESSKGDWGGTMLPRVDNPNVGTSVSSPLFSCGMHRGTQLYVYIADITKLPVAAIANAANERLQHGGGVASAIAHASGPHFQRDSTAHVKKHGKVPLSQAVALPAGPNLPCMHVINAVGPVWSYFRNKAQCKNVLTGTFFNVFKCANQECKVSSVAVPLISSGV